MKKYTLDLRHTNLTNEIYTAPKPRTDWVPTLVAIVALIMFCWGVLVITGLAEIAWF